MDPRDEDPPGPAGSDDADDPELAEIRRKIREDVAARATAAAAAPEGPVVVTDATLPRLVQEEPLVLVDCWAAWCGPCQMMEPVVERLAEDLAGTVVVAKLDVDANPMAARALGAMSIPTFVLFKDGRPVDRVVGAVAGSKLEAMVRQHSGASRVRGRGGPGPRR